MYKVAIDKNKKVEPQVQTIDAVPMLSELYIQLPKPNPIRKISFVNHQQKHITEYQTFYHADQREIHQISDEFSINNNNNSNNNVPINTLKPKKSQFLQNSRSDGEIILGWIKSIFQKKNLIGPHWQDKIKSKRFSLMKSAFQKLKQERQSVYSPYLQTQSRHKPYFNKQHHLLMMGLQKFNEVYSNIALKQKRTVFSKILRFLAFQNVPFKPNSKMDSFTFQQQSTGSLNSKNHGREQKISKQLSPNNRQFIMPVYVKQVITPIKQQAKNNDYVANKQAQFRTPIKQVQSSKNLIFSTNEYALTPATAIKQQLTDHKKPKRQNNFLVTESKMSKNSDRSKGNTDLVNSKSQPHHLAIGGIGGNFKYEFNQHNYIVVQPQNMQLTHQLPTVNPPSPLSHQFTPTVKFHAPQMKQMNIQPIPLVLKQSNHLEKRDPNYIRPYSHNPFTTQPNTGKSSSQQNIIEDRNENRKSRSISASGNIKISFMSKQQQNAKQVRNKGNDYLQEDKLKYQDIYKLGTRENRKLRQHYQLNSYGNQLVHQDYIPSPQTPNFIYSTPISPKPQQFYAKNIHVNYVTPNPQSPVTPRSHRNFGSQSFMPITTQSRQIPQQMKQSAQITPIQASKRTLRQKILVTSSQRQK